MSYGELATLAGVAEGTLNNGAYARFRPFGRPRAESIASALNLTLSQREDFLSAFDALPLSPAQTKARDENKESIARRSQGAAYTLRGLMLAIEKRYAAGPLDRDELLAWIGSDEWRAQIKRIPPPGTPKPSEVTFDPTKIEPSHPIYIPRTAGNAIAWERPINLDNWILDEPPPADRLHCWLCNEFVRRGHACSYDDKDGPPWHIQITLPDEDSPTESPQAVESDDFG